MRLVLPATVAMALLGLLASPATASVFSRGRLKTGGSNLTLRDRLHIDPLITPPGTAEVDISSVYSFSGGNYQMPSVIKFTPRGSHVFWGRTEYSVAFDSLDNSSEGGGRLTQFSQSVTCTATAVLHDGERFDLALAPQATFFLRDEAGARLGAIAILRYDGGRNSLGATAGWSAATHSSGTNPAGTLDLGAGYGRNLSGSSLAEKLTPHVNVVWEKPEGHPSALSIFEGIEYQITERVACDISAQHFTVTGGVADHQVVVGIAVTLGRLHRATNSQIVLH